MFLTSVDSFIPRLHGDSAKQMSSSPCSLAVLSILPLAFLSLLYKMLGLDALIYRTPLRHV